MSRKNLETLTWQAGKNLEYLWEKYGKIGRLQKAKKKHAKTPPQTAPNPQKCSTTDCLSPSDDKVAGVQSVKRSCHIWQSNMEMMLEAKIEGKSSRNQIGFSPIAENN